MRARVRSNRQPIRQRQSSGPVSIENCSVEPAEGPVPPNQRIRINFEIRNELDQEAHTVVGFGGNGKIGEEFGWTIPPEGRTLYDSFIPTRDLGWPVNGSGQLRTEMVLKDGYGGIWHYETCGTIQIQPPGDGGNGGNGDNGNGGNGDNGNGGNGGNGNGGNGQPGQGGQELSMQTIGLVVLVLLAVVYTQTDWLNQAYDAASGAI